MVQLEKLLFLVYYCTLSSKVCEVNKGLIVRYIVLQRNILNLILSVIHAQYNK